MFLGLSRLKGFVRIEDTKVLLFTLEDTLVTEDTFTLLLDTYTLDIHNKLYIKLFYFLKPSKTLKQMV